MEKLIIKLRYILTGCYLSKNQQIKVLEYSLNELNKYPRGICFCILYSLNKLFDIDVQMRNIPKYIPYYMKHNIEYYGGGSVDAFGYYWKPLDKQSRINFINWMINKTKDGNRRAN